MGRLWWWGGLAVAGVALGCGGDDDGGAATDEARVLAADECLMDDCTCGAREDEIAVVPVPPEELDDWVAAQIPLTAKPYEVDTVVFGLASPDAGSEFEPCVVEQETTVQLWVTDSETPPAEPEAAFSWTGAVVPNPGQAVTMEELTVDPPVRVEDGQHLFFAIQMTGTTSAFLCLYSCKTVTPERAQMSWWSAKDEPPHDAWATLDDYGLDNAYNVGVRGRVVD